MAVALISSFYPHVNSNGVPLNAGTIDVYAAGTTTPLSLYPNDDLTGSTLNPITLGAEGYHPITYIATAKYKLVIKNSAGTTIRTIDNIDPGVAIGSGALPVANGGTAATTAAGARTNLSAAAATDMATAQSDIANLQTWTGYTLTTRTRWASGTTAQRPAAGTVGVRYNSTTGFFEADNGSAWANLMRQGQALPADFATGSGRFVIQRTRVTSLSNASSATVTPYDNTTPTITEGAEAFTNTFTPASANSLIKVRCAMHYGINAGVHAILALHKNNGSAVATSAIGHDATQGGFQFLEYEESPGSVSPITYALRCGPSSAATITFNGSTTLGGTMMSFMEIQEWLAP